jgi:hypothetical protein
MITRKEIIGDLNAVIHKATALKNIFENHDVINKQDATDLAFAVCCLGDDLFEDIQDFLK